MARPPRIKKDRRPSGSEVPAKFPDDALKNSRLYQEFLAELDEILRHKWLESEKAGHDVGFDRALLGWIRHHRTGWKQYRERMTA